MNAKSVFAKIALYMSVLAMVGFALDALAQPAQVGITAPASDGMHVATGSSVTFTGTATDPNGLALNYSWSFSDGTSQNGQTVAYQIPATATVGSTITATLTVTNSANEAATTQPTRSVTVGLAQPTQVSITSPASDGMNVAAGRSVTFTGNATESDPNALPLIYTWNFSDGTSQTGQTVNYPVAASATAGSTISATLNVTNSTNVLADTQPTRSVTVISAPVSANLIYVANYFANTVTLIDPASNQVVTTLTVNGRPYGRAISADGKYTYIVYPKNGVPSGTVSVFDTVNRVVISAASVGNTPNGTATTPDGTLSYATNFDYLGSVTVTSTATNTVTSTIGVGRYPTAVAITPDGTSAYVANYWDGTVSVIGIAGNTVTTTIPVGPYPFSVGNVLLTPATTFSAFSVQNLTIAPRQGVLSFSSTFTLGDTSVGIAPALQATLLRIGNFVLAIPPGAFKQIGWGGPYWFSGTFQGMAVQALLQPLGGQQYSLEAYAFNAILIGIPTPATVQLTIGGENGTTTVNPTLSP